jgi:hypothetical protein
MVNRDIIINFINKYNLDAGSSRGETAVILKAENGMLATTMKSEDLSLMAQVVAKNSGVEDGKYAIYNTSTLLSLIKLMQNEFELLSSGQGNSQNTWHFKDDNYTADFRLADAAIIPTANISINLPEFQIQMDIDSIFTEKYLKSLSALPSPLISFTQQKGSVVLNINHSEHKSHKISIPLNIPAPQELVEPIVFDANRFKDLLSVNKDANIGKLSISVSGLLALEFKSESIVSKYYMVSKIS